MKNLAIETIKTIVAKAGTQAEAAAQLGISPAYLSDILLGKREVSEAVAAKLGLMKEIHFVHMPAVKFTGKGDEIGSTLHPCDEASQ